MFLAIDHGRIDLRKKDIAVKIEELNYGKQEEEFSNIPVYDVLEKNRIVRKQSNGEFILNSVKLSRDQC
jgi:hypothetical protein